MSRIIPLTSFRFADSRILLAEKYNTYTTDRAVRPERKREKERKRERERRRGKKFVT